MTLEELNSSADMLRVLAHPARIALVSFMLEKGPVNVTSLYEGLEMPQSTVSQHLAKLKALRLSQVHEKV